MHVWWSFFYLGDEFAIDTIEEYVLGIRFCPNILPLFFVKGRRLLTSLVDNRPKQRSKPVTTQEKDS